MTAPEPIVTPSSMTVSSIFQSSGPRIEPSGFVARGVLSFTNITP